MAENRTHGKIDSLPVEVKTGVEESLLSGKTYKEISDDLNDAGYDVHESSVGRYGRKYLKRFESVRVAKQFAKLLAEDEVDRPPTEMHEANNMIMSQILMEAMMDGEMKAKEMASVAKSIATLQSAQVNNERLKIKARENAGDIHTAMNVLKEKIFKEIAASHPDVAQILTELANETEEEMKNNIKG